MERSILVTQNGPYVIAGPVTIAMQKIVTNADGESVEWETVGEVAEMEKAALCRCGHSKNAPFCDGTHAKIGFQGEETASPTGFADSVAVIDGPEYEMLDARPFCAAARFCDAGLDAWDGAEQASTPEAVEHLKHQTTRCPSGRLVLRNKRTGELLEPSLPVRIAAVQDPSQGCSGPLWVTGGVPVKSQGGAEYEVRNRMTLCRCGGSKNKPFCDGSHLDIGYDDGSGRAKS